MSIHAYLEWNVFNKIEKVDQLEGDEKLVYLRITDSIINGSFIVPYSMPISVILHVDG